jgi:YgiT-type zinc finger domain-containing protein
MLMVKCHLCGKGNLSKKKVPYTLYGTQVGMFNGLVCSSCGEALFDEATDKKIEAKAKELGLYGLGSNAKLR